MIFNFGTTATVHICQLLGFFTTRNVVKPLAFQTVTYPKMRKKHLVFKGWISKGAVMLNQRHF